MKRIQDHHLIAVLALTLLALCATGIARAQSSTRSTPCDSATPNNALCVSWGAVTAATDGTAISGVTYRVEQRAGTSGSYATVANGSALQYYAKGLNPGTYYFRVYANCTACTSESAASNTANGAATPIPVVPTSPVIIIAATINANGPPTYRIIQSVTLRPNEVVFAAPASMRAVFANR